MVYTQVDKMELILMELIDHQMKNLFLLQLITVRSIYLEILVEWDQDQRSTLAIRNMLLELNSIKISKMFTPSVDRIRHSFIGKCVDGFFKFVFKEKISIQ